MSSIPVDYRHPAAGSQHVRRIRWRCVACDVAVYAALLIFAAITLIPFAYLICAAFKQSDDFFTSLFLPRHIDAAGQAGGIAWDHLTLSHFHRLLTELDFLPALVNSVFLSCIISVLATLCSAMGGYALAKFRFRGRSTATFVILASLVVPGALLIAPSYQLLYRLHLLDSYAALILPAIAPAFGVYLFRQAMITSLPDELLEAARMDGCGEFRMFFQIALPLVRPMIGAFLLITFLGTWNNFIGPQIVLQSPEKFPLSVAIAQLKSTQSQDYGLLMAGTLVSIVPVLALFLLLQREFIAGLTAGAVKG